MSRETQNFISTTTIKEFRPKSSGRLSVVGSAGKRLSTLDSDLRSLMCAQSAIVWDKLDWCVINIAVRPGRSRLQGKRQPV